MVNFPNCDGNTWPFIEDSQIPRNLDSYPKISVITPSFNQGEFIEATIRSVLLQGYPNIEYIIIDGGSTDRTIEVIEKYSEFITYWKSEPDQGQSNAINKGLKIATGDIINWLNSDDYYEPGALHKVAEAFLINKANVVCGKSIIFSDLERKVSSGTDIYPGNLPKTLGWARIDQPETFFSSSVIKKMGPLNEQYHYIMDREWWIRFLLYFGLDGVIQIDDILVNFRLHDNSKSVSLKNNFNDERNNFFYSLALLHGYQDIVSLLEDIEFGVKRINLFEKKLYAQNPFLIKRALNYFLLLLAEEFYVSMDSNRLNQCISEIQIDLLNKSDVTLFKKLKKRNKIVYFLLRKVLKN